MHIFQNRDVTSAEFIVFLYLCPLVNRTHRVYVCPSCRCLWASSRHTRHYLYLSFPCPWASHRTYRPYLFFPFPWGSQTCLCHILYPCHPYPCPCPYPRPILYLLLCFFP